MYDPNCKAPTTSREVSMAENRKNASDDVIISIAEDEKDTNFPLPDSSKHQSHKLSLDSPSRLSKDSTFSHRKSVQFNCASPEISSLAASPNKPPRIPKYDVLARRKTFSRSVYSKPKSRFGEQSMPVDRNTLENDALFEDDIVSSHGSRSPITKTDSNRTIPLSPKTPLISSPTVNFVDEDEKIYMKVKSRKKCKHRKVKAWVLIEWLLLLCVLGCLIISLTVDKLQRKTIWGLRIWRWCVLVLVTLSGLLFTKWLMHFVVLLIELNFMLKKKVLYFVYGLKNSVRVCIWLALVLLTWVLLIQERVERSGRATQILDFITSTIISLLIGSSMWLVKTLLLKILASSFHVNTFFDRIQDSIFHQYILLTLSGPPVMELAKGLGKASDDNIGKFSPVIKKKNKEGKEKEEKEKQVIDINKLHQMKQDKVSASTMKILVDVISNSGLTTLSNAIGESVYGGANAQMDKEINNEEEAIAAAYHIFRNVAQPGCKFIDELDLLRFMSKEEVEIIFPMIDVAEIGQIDRRTLTDWVVKVYEGRKSLGHALTDTKTAVKQLNKLVSGILIAIMILVWLLLVEIANTKVLVLLSSQLALAVFVFGNTCKTIFEAIIFVFVMHPFDVGDRCAIDGVHMIVEEMNILTTVFLKYDNEKIYIPNSVLATKPISNFYRSPDMSDSFEFSIDFKTPVEKIGTLKLKIKEYLESNPQQWYPNHSVVVKEIENVNKIKMALYFNHTINFQNYSEKSRRKTGLVLEMKRIFEELGVGYDLLPQEVRLVETNRATTERY